MFIGLLRFLRYWNRGRGKIEVSSLPLVVQIPLKIISWIFFRVIIFYFMLFQSVFLYSFIVSGSMSPTLLTNEVVILNTVAYNLRFMGLSYLSKKAYFNNPIKLATPKMGDIVAFTTPEVLGEIMYKKRLLAMGPCTVQFKDGICYIDDKPCPLEFKGMFEFEENNKKHMAYLYVETLPNGVKYNVIFLQKPGKGLLDNTKLITVPAEHAIMVGDNRQNSDDGRKGVVVPQKFIVGRAVFVLFSHANLRTITLNPITFLKGIRWNRCFTWFH